jgi:hypothetical protein
VVPRLDLRQLAVALLLNSEQSVMEQQVSYVLRQEVSGLAPGV